MVTFTPGFITCSLALGLLATALVVPSSNAPSSPVSVTFMARGMSLEQGSVTGHSFMVISVTTPKGMVSDAFGFYPRDNGLSMIKGPGMLKREFRCTDAECLALKASSQGVTKSVTIPISEDERKSVLALVDAYNVRTARSFGEVPPQYVLTSQNCNAFVGEVASALGYPIPAPEMLPTAYVESLTRLVRAEQERRARVRAEEEERERQALERQREREEERLRLDRLRREEEARLAEERRERERERERERDRERRERERREAESYVPSGWVRCKCPGAHSRYGRIINGARWHAESNLQCP